MTKIQKNVTGPSIECVPKDFGIARVGVVHGLTMARFENLCFEHSILFRI